VRKPAFYWHFFHSRYAEALAQCSPRTGCGDAMTHYAHYRLGLYRTAAEAPARRAWYSMQASLASLAACGRSEEAAERAHEIVRRGSYRQQRAQLASALAPYLPEQALALTEGCEVQPTLRAALLIRSGRQGEALHLLESLKKTGSRLSELPLFRSNAAPASPQHQLRCLNQFLTSFGLSELSLRDRTQAPGAMNLVTAVEPSAVDGPLVTVLMTAYCAAPHIACALESLQRQSWRNLEIIVIDDASNDGTAEIVAAIAREDDRIRYLRLPCNAGTYVAKNVGLRHARGDFVTCHDADDWAHPDRIARQAQPLCDDAGLMFTTSYWVRIQDDGIYHARPVHPLMRLNPASPMFRKNAVLHRAGVWDCVRTGADSEFHARLRLVFGPRAWRRIPLPLTIGAHRPGSLMTAAATGYDERGLSPTRLAYWEAWGSWHIDALRSRQRPFLSMPEQVRRFQAPAEICVPDETIAACMADAAP
jgi:hypothetical protein